MLTLSQLIYSYFLPTGQIIVFIVGLYLDFLCDCFLKLIKHSYMILSAPL